MRILLSLLLLIVILTAGPGFLGILRGNHVAADDTKINHLKDIDTDKIDWKAKDDAFWKENLGKLQYKVSRHDGTEYAFTGKYNKENREGVYHCSSCGLALFDSKTKFNSGTGWPSYYEPIKKEAINEVVDTMYGMRRVEVECSRCGAHLGHVFTDGPKPTGLRYCINSVSLVHSDDLK